MDIVPVLLANAVAAGILAAVVALVCALVRRPAFAARAWLVVLLKLLAPPLIAVPVLWSSVAPPANETKNYSATITNSQEDDGSLVLDNPLDAIPWEADTDFSHQPFAEPAERGLAVPAIPTLGSTPSEKMTGEVPAAPPILSYWRQLLVFVWLTGVLVYWGLALVRIVRFQRLLRQADSATDVEREFVRDIARRMGLRTIPRLLFTSADISPLAWPSLRGACILAPRRLWERLTHDQRRSVLAHELAHVRRGDPWVRFVELCGMGLYWWLPVAWIARRQMRNAEEACCDAWVVWALPDQAPAYAEALVETAAFISSPSLAPLASSGAARLSTLKRRLFMILKNPPAHRLRWPLGLALATFAIALLPWRLTVAEEQQPPSPPKPPTAKPVPNDPTSPKPKLPGGDAPKPKITSANEPAAPMSNSKSRWATPSAESVEGLEEEVAVLEAHLDTRKAMYRGAEVELRALMQRVEEVRRLVESKIASRSELLQAETAVEKGKVNLDVKAAEVKEQEVRLAFAKRRLSRMKTPTLNPASSALNTLRERRTPADQAEAQVLAARLSELEAQAAMFNTEIRKLDVELAALTERAAALQQQRKQLEVLRTELQNRLRSVTPPPKPADNKPK